MNLKRLVLACVGAFVTIVVGDYLIHELWLGGFYRATASWWRPAEQMRSLMGLMFLSEAALAAVLTLIYTKGYEASKGTLSQGFRFGVLMGVLLGVPSTLMKAFVYPYPAPLILNWMVGTLVEITVAGSVIGALYKSAK